MSPGTAVFMHTIAPNEADMKMHDTSDCTPAMSVAWSAILYHTVREGGDDGCAQG